MASSMAARVVWSSASMVGAASACCRIGSVLGGLTPVPVGVIVWWGDSYLTMSAVQGTSVSEGRKERAFRVVGGPDF